MKNNESYQELFSDESLKAKSFERIAELFYDKNFSSATKSEIELLLFSIYLDAKLDRNKKADNTVNYGDISDYALGKELGIPQEKVRSLKVRKQARYPVEFDWKASLFSIKDSIRYDDIKKRIIIPTRDPNLYIEICNYIENHGGYIEVQRSGNVIQIRPEHFFMLAYEDLNDEEQKKCREELIRELYKHNSDNTIPEPHTARQVLEIAGKIANCGVGVLEVIFSENLLFKILKQVFDSIM